MTAHRHLDEDRVLDLVNSLLPGTERRSTLGQAAACRECESLLREMAATYERAQSRAAQQIHLAGTPATPRDHPIHELDEIARVREAPVPREVTVLRAGPSRWQRSRRPVFGIAAVVIAASVGSYSLWQRQAGHRASGIGDVDWLPVPRPIVLNRDSLSVTADEALSDGIAAYRAQDAATAVRLLRLAHVTGALEQVRLLYLGNALLQLDRAHEAVDALQSVQLATVPEPWRTEALWFLGVAWRAAGETSRADSLLRELSAVPGEIGDRARRAQAAASR